MFSIHRIAATVAGVALLFPSSIWAHSVKREPVNYVTTIENAKIHTPSQRVHSYSDFALTFTLHDGTEEIRLELEPNIDLIPEGFTVTFLNEDGTEERVNKMQQQDYKVYRGRSYVRRKGHEGWFLSGWARIMMHEDGENPIFDGAFRINSNNHHIEAGHRYGRIKHGQDPHVETTDNTMVVWRDSDVRPADGQLELKRNEPTSSSTCAADTSDFNRQYDLTSRNFEPLEAVSNRSLFGRQAIDGGGTGPAGDLSATIGDTSGCPTSRKIALVGIATDCNYWKHFWTQNRDQTYAAVEKNIIGMVNKASEVYESSFKISLGLQNVTIQQQNCSGSGSQGAPWNVECGPSVNLGDRLSLFSKWRGEKTDTNAYWTLLTTCNTDATVGFAWRGQLCRQGSTPNGGNSNETISSANVIALTATEWQVFAHETGHTFGAVHDCTRQTCPGGSDAQPCCPLTTSSCDAGGNFIMNPSTGTDITAFSKCSIGNICSGLKGNVKSDCLTTNRNVKLYSGSVCGNGIVEPGEDCDCGSADKCKNTCCDPKTCKFTQGSVCDPFNEDCCTSQCQFAGTDKTCRASTGPCDPEEKCSGSAGLCPEDKHKDNGQSCGDGLECASGTCTSRDQQCKVSFGRLSSSPKSCGNECLMQCSGTDYNGGQCTYFNSYFIDGTSCSGGGQCKDGQCQGGSWFKTFTDWYTSHLSISIPVTIVVGLLIITIISSCFCSCFRRRPQMRKPKTVSPVANTPPNNGGWQAYGGEYAPTQHNMNNMTMSGPYGYYNQQENANQHNSPYSHGQSYNNNNSQYPNSYNMQDMSHNGNYPSQDHYYPPPPPPPPPAYGNTTNTRYA